MESKTMRLFEIDDSRLKRRIKNAIDKLDDSDPANQSLLNDLKGLLFRHHIPSNLEKTGLKQRIADY